MINNPLELSGVKAEIRIGNRRYHHHRAVCLRQIHSLFHIEFSTVCASSFNFQYLVSLRSLVAAYVFLLIFPSSLHFLQ